MKTNIKVKEEPVELQNYANETVNKLLRIYGYNLTNHQSESTVTKFKSNAPSATNDTISRTKSSLEQEPSTCAWCQKLGCRSFTLRTDNGDSKALCSEVCFNQFRRASFKKNKGSESDGIIAAVPTKNHSQTRKNKSPTSVVVSEKKSKITLGTNGHTTDKRESHQPSSVENNRRKLVLPVRRSTTTNEAIQKLPPSLPASPPAKRHRSSSSSSSSLPLTLPVRSPNSNLTNLPVSLAWPPSLLVPPSIVWPPTVDMTRFQYPFFVPPPPPPRPPVLPLPTTASSSEHLPISTLFTSLTKGVSSTITCILPTFIPLPIPIPIPLCFPVHLPCVKCSVNVNNQTCQTELDCFSILKKRTRRISV